MDDITFCLSDCQRTECFRHPSNIQDRTIPHSYADFRETDTCPSRQLIEKMQLSDEDATKDATFDYIDRQAAIDAVCEYCEYFKNENVIQSIKEIPSVQPQRWIPVTEALPEKPFGCLVTVMDTEPMTMEEFENILPYFVGYDGEQWNDWEGYQCPLEVLAWMPIPEPYAERRQDG